VEHDKAYVGEGVKDEEENVDPVTVIEAICVVSRSEEAKESHPLKAENSNRGEGHRG